MSYLLEEKFCTFFVNLANTFPNYELVSCTFQGAIRNQNNYFNRENLKNYLSSAEQKESIKILQK